MNDQTVDLTPSEGPVPVHLSTHQIDNILEDMPGGQSVSEDTRRLRQELHDARRRGAQLLPAPRVPEDDVFHAPPMPVRPAPVTRPQPFYIVCRHDVAGTTGVGVIAEGCQFSDGALVVRQLEGPAHSDAGWRFYDSREDADAVLKRSWSPSIVDVVSIDADEPS